MWQQYPKHSTSLACTVGWQQESHYLKSPPWVPFEECKKNNLQILKPRGKKFCGLMKPRWNFLAYMQKVMLVHTQHSTSSKEHHPYCEAWWWQHHVMGTCLISRDWSTCQDQRENGWSKVQKNLKGKPAALCKKAEIGMEVHLSAWQRPEAHRKSYTGVAKEQKYKCPWVAESEPWLESNRKSVAWLEDCCP